MPSILGVSVSLSDIISLEVGISIKLRNGMILGTRKNLQSGIVDLEVPYAKAYFTVVDCRHVRDTSEWRSRALAV